MPVSGVENLHAVAKRLGGDLPRAKDHLLSLHQLVGPNHWAAVPSPSEARHSKVIMPSYSSPSLPPRPLQVLRRIDRLLRMRLLMVVVMRTAVVTALVSGIGYRLITPEYRLYTDGTQKGTYGLGDIAYIGWLVFSSALFYPCAALIDLGLCAAIAYKIRAVVVPSYLRNKNQAEIPMMCLVLLCAFVEFVTILCIGLLRTLGFCLAITETYYLTRKPQARTSLRHAAFNLILRSQYDWWTFRPLPESFTARKWYQRIMRPWLPSTPLASSPPQGCGQDVTPLVSIFFGTKTFQARRGERLWFVILRGLAAVGCLSAIIAYATNVLFLQPIDENRGPPIQMQRLPSLPTADKMPPPTWGVIVGIDTRNVRLPPGVPLSDLVSVSSEVPTGSDVTPPCSPTPFISPRETLSTFQLISYQCVALWIDRGDVYTPQILIGADYAALNISRSHFSLERSIKIWPSFTTNVAQVLESTRPASLIMGNNIIASVTGTLRSSFTDPTRATFGFDSHRRTYLVGQLTVLGVDPLAPVPAPASSVATLRIFKELRSTDWELYTDTRQRTILAGLSAVGGISVFFNSAFIILFGGGLMLVLFDLKPLSIFGLFHLFSRTTLSDKLTTDFPGLRIEGGQPGHGDSGLVAFMREYMLDLAILPPESKTLDEPANDAPMGGLSGISLGIDGCGVEPKDRPSSSTPNLPDRLGPSFVQQLRLHSSRVLRYILGAFPSQKS